MTTQQSKRWRAKNKRGGRKLDRGELAELKEKYSSGVGLGDLAFRFGLNLKTVRKHLAKMGILA